MKLPADGASRRPAGGIVKPWSGPIYVFDAFCFCRGNGIDGSDMHPVDVSGCIPVNAYFLDFSGICLF